MAQGALRGGALTFPVNDHAHLGRDAGDYGSRGLVDAAVRPKLRAGPKTNAQPIAIRSIQHPGTVRRALFDDYYNRVYLIPSVLDFGPTALDTRRSYYIWNARFQATTLETIEETDTAGTALSGPVAPFVYGALALYQYEGIAFGDGPAQFLSSYRFTFSNGESPTLTMLGERARLLPVFPNWRESYKVSLEFKTEILESRSGREQRRALRQRARKGIEFTATARDAAQLRAFNRYMLTWQNRVSVLPEETKFAVVAIGVLADNTVVEVESVPDWLTVDAPLLIRSRFNEFEFLSSVKSVVGTSVELDGTIPDFLPAGSRIMLAQYGRLRQQVDSARYTNAVVETDIGFDVNPGSDPLPIIQDIPLTLDGRPVFTVKPNWSDSPKLTYLHPREEIDYGFGRTAIFAPVEFASRTLDYFFSGLSEGDVRKITDLFLRMRGRQGEFYYPSWENDLTFDQPLLAGARTMEFSGETFFNAYQGDTTHRAVFIVTKDDEIVVNSIVGEPVLSDGVTLFTFNYDWPKTIDPRDVKFASWLYASRFATDKMVVEWLTREVAQVKTTFQTLEDLPE